VCQYNILKLLIVYENNKKDIENMVFINYDILTDEHRRRLDMNPGKEKRIEWLKWLVNFCNTDLNSLGVSERSNLASGLARFVFEDDSEAVAEDEAGNQYDIQFLMPPTVLESLSISQGRMKDFLNKLIEIDGKISTAKEGQSPSYFAVLPKVDLKPVLMVGPDRLLKVEFVDGDLLPEEKGDKIDFIRFDPKEMWSFWWDFLRGKSPDLEKDYLLINIIHKLMGGSIGWIQKCKGCDRFFLNPTKKVKIYCSSSCACRSITRAEREELKKDPAKYQAYLEKQREYNKKSYKKKMRAKHGHKVLIGRRSSKQGDGAGWSNS